MKICFDSVFGGVFDQPSFREPCIDNWALNLRPMISREWVGHKTKVKEILLRAQMYIIAGSAFWKEALSVRGDMIRG